MTKKITKTNAMRILEASHINYNLREYPDHDGPIAATEVAKYLGQPPEKMFKTLVTTDLNRNYFVFCIPGDEELDLKKAAKVAGVKKIEMLKQKDLLGLTGYIHGGCSPVGMKKVFPTFMHKTALDIGTVYVSGGKIGLQIEINPKDIEKILDMKFEDLIKE